jgi:FAD/FMN-containing dehydrogenase
VAVVKKYRGSLSGEHGDGIVRGEFCLYDWRQNYELLKRIKLAFDPNSVLNMGKIVNALKWMKTSVLKREGLNQR